MKLSDLTREDILGTLKVLEKLEAYFLAEDQRMARMLPLIGATEARLTQSLKLDKDKPVLDCLAMGLTLTYKVGEESYSIPSAIVAAFTYKGAPVVWHPSQCPSVQHLARMSEDDTQKIQRLSEVYTEVPALDQVITDLLYNLGLKEYNANKGAEA